jgi:hypothetical protein
MFPCPSIIIIITFVECRLLGCDAVSIVRTNISEEIIAYIIGVKRISELGTTLAVTSN